MVKRHFREMVFVHSESTQRALGDLGARRAVEEHWGTRTLTALMHSRTLRHLGHSGTWELEHSGHSRHSGTETLGHSRHFICPARFYMPLQTKFSVTVL